MVNIGGTFSYLTLAIIPGGRDCYYSYAADEEKVVRRCHEVSGEGTVAGIYAGILAGCDG